MKNSVLEQHRKRNLRKRSLLLLSVLVLLCAFCVRIGFLLNTETVGDANEKPKVKSDVTPQNTVNGKSPSEEKEAEVAKVKDLLNRLTEIFESEQNGVELSVYIKDLDSDAKAVYNSKK